MEWDAFVLRIQRVLRLRRGAKQPLGGQEEVATALAALARSHLVPLAQPEGGRCRPTDGLYTRDVLVGAGQGDVGGGKAAGLGGSALA